MIAPLPGSVCTSALVDIRILKTLLVLGKHLTKVQCETEILYLKW